MAKLPLLLLVCIVAVTAHTSIFFEKYGYTSAATDRGHIVFKLKLDTILLKAQEAVQLIDKVNQQADNEADRLYLKSTTHAIRGTLVSIKTLLTLNHHKQLFTIGSKTSTSAPAMVTTSSITTGQREKRGTLDTFITLSKLTHTLFGIITTLKQQGTLTHLKHNVQVNSQALAKVVKVMNEMIEKMKVSSQQLDSATTSIFHTMLATFASTTLTHLRNLQYYLLSLKNNRIPVGLVTKADLTKAYQQLEDALAGTKLEILIKKPINLYHLPVDVIYVQGKGLFLILTAYLSQPQDILQVYSLKHFPIAIKEGLLMTFVSQFTHIAIGGHDDKDNHGQLYTPEEFRKCQTNLNFTYCDNRINYRNLSNTCIYNLLRENSHGILHNCKVDFHDDTQQAYQITGTEFLVYSTQPDKLTMKCKHQTTNVTFNGRHNFILDAQCPEAFTTHYHFKRQLVIDPVHHFVDNPHYLNETIFMVNNSLIKHILEPLKQMPTTFDDDIAQLQPLYINDIVTPPYVLYARIIYQWLKNYSVIIIILTMTYMICHIMHCVCVGREACSRHTMDLEYYEVPDLTAFQLDPLERMEHIPQQDQPPILRMTPVVIGSI